ncbi:hypothetical protein [Streptomyces sp. SID2888]|uniref:hypothetical protein n=1 Tax=Streptomyces sp. SID2888 TaxID=2690256 RepID=UPI00136AA786|nr:hypothetical protein [Streptomyces sp. SID2888]MYV44197.1 hypothetical protein [Streptomyces sp. SID2888]
MPSRLSAERPTPLLFRSGAGHKVTAAGVALGAASTAVRQQGEEAPAEGGLLLLGADGPLSGHREPATVRRPLDPVPPFTRGRVALDCLRTVMTESGENGRADDAAVPVTEVVA